MRRQAGDAALRLAGLAVFAGVWHGLAVLVIHELPTPVETVAAFWTLTVRGEPILGRTLWQHAMASVGRVLAGSTAAAAIAIPLGLVRGRNRELDELAIAGTEMIRPIPPIAWIPLASIVFIAVTGTVSLVKVFIVFIGAFFPMLLNALHGARAVDPVHIDVARSYRASRGMIMRTIVLPSALPYILTGVRVGLGVAWMSIMAAEMIGGSATGLGYFVLAMYTIGGDTPAIVAGMAAIGLIGFGMNEILVLVGKKVIRWV